MGYIFYLGHSGFEITLDELTIYIDPYLEDSPDRVVKAAITPSGIKKADLLFITHEHFDHFERNTVLDVVERMQATVVAPSIVLRELDIPLSSKVDVRVGDSFSLKGIDVEVIKAIHPQSKDPVGFILRKGGKSIYHAGDTYEFMEMVDLKVDYAILPIGGTYTMDPIDAHKAAKEIRCRYIIPMHYNTWERIRQNTRDFANSLADTKVKPIVLKVGESIEI